MLETFSDQRQLMVFQSPEVSKTFLCILADLSKDLVCIVSIRFLIAKSSNPFTNLLMTVPRASITISITSTFVFHSFFNSQVRLRYYPLLFAFFQIYCGQPKQQSSQLFMFSFFFVVVVEYNKIWSLLLLLLLLLLIASFPLQR